MRIWLAVWLLALGGGADEVHPNSTFMHEQPSSESNQMISAPNGQDWLVIVGRDQKHVSMVSINFPQLKLKSIFLEYDRRDQPMQLAIFDSLNNLQPIVNTIPGSISKMKEKMRERAELGQVLAEMCPSEREDGQLVLTSIWGENPEAVSQLYILNGTETNVESLIHPLSLPVSVCGFKFRGRELYVLVTIRPKAATKVDVAKVKVLVGLKLSECFEEDKKLGKKSFVAQRFRIHSDGDNIKCSAIYWHSPGTRHLITMAESASVSQHQEALKNSSRNYKLYSPKSISHAGNMSLMLWSTMPIWPFPSAPSLLSADRFVLLDEYSHPSIRPIPFRYQPGVNFEIPTETLSFINNRIVAFMQKMDIPGLSMAVVKNELLKLVVSFGYADVLRQTPLTPNDQLRIGSISKIITATAVFQLIEDGNLGLDEHVFGFAGILGMDMTAEDNYPRFVDQITVRHLLTHTVGAWSNAEEDPVFHSGTHNPSDLIRFVIKEVPLKTPPGEVYAYSNVGYAILGRVIEYRSGMPYVEFVNRRIFIPIGLGRQMTLSGRFRAPPEGNVLYYTSPESPDDPYEIPHPSVLEACCGWVLSPVEVIKLATHIDGFPLRKDLLTAESIRQMTIPTRQSNYSYAMGWSINERGFNGRSHQGQMPSALSFLIRADSGVELVISTNRYPALYSVDSEIAYLAHHIATLFEEADLNGFDHFLDNPMTS